jgi:hypothetical protein
MDDPLATIYENNMLRGIGVSDDEIRKLNK